MSLSNDVIRLQPEFEETEQMFRIWNDLTRCSVEVIAANRVALYGFAAQDCMFFATIKRTIKADKGKGTSKISLPQLLSDEDTICDQYSPRPTPSHYFGDSGEDGSLQCEKTVGIIYLTSSHLPESVNLGLAILPEQQGKGFGSQAVRILLGWAFDELHCHRIQVRILEGNRYRSDVAIGMFTLLGFSFEGVTRHALFCPPQSEEEMSVGMDGVFRDLTTLALLETDWVMRRELSKKDSALKASWDRMFRRHEEERQDMLALEEREDRRRRLKRSISAETTTEDVGGSVGEGDYIRNGDILDKVDKKAKNLDNDLETPSFERDVAELDNILEGMLTGGQYYNANDTFDSGSSRSALIHRQPFDWPKLQQSSFHSLEETCSAQLAEGDCTSEASYHSSSSSPLLPHSSPLVNASDIEDMSDVESVPRSTSVMSSNQSTGSWDMWDSSSDTASVLSFSEAVSD